MASSSKSAAVRARLSHPVIDGDGHWLEPLPIFLDYLKQVGGPSLVAHFKAKDVERGWYGMTRDERIRRGVARAVNLMNAEMFAPYRDRIAPAAVVPVFTPEEAIEEATYAVKAVSYTHLRAHETPEHLVC